VSQIGKGSTFTIFLPVWQQANSEEWITGEKHFEAEKQIQSL